MADPYRIALATVRLFAVINLVSGALLFLFCAIALVTIFATGTIEMFAYVLGLLTYVIIYAVSGLAQWLWARPMARFAAKAFQS